MASLPGRMVNSEQVQAELPASAGVKPGASGIAIPSLPNAPTPTTYGDFVAPNPVDVASDPYYQFRAKEGEKALQRSAAARGTLLTGGMLKALEGYRQGLASEEAGNAFNRALSTYTTNRDTNAQNFGQQMGSYNAGLSGFNAATGADTAYGTLGLNRDRFDFDRETQQKIFDREDAAKREADQEAERFAALVDQQRAQQTMLAPSGPVFPTRSGVLPGVFAGRVPLRG